MREWRVYFITRCPRYHGRVISQPALKGRIVEGGMWCIRDACITLDHSGVNWITFHSSFWNNTSPGIVTSGGTMAWVTPWSWASRDQGTCCAGHGGRGP